MWCTSSRKRWSSGASLINAARHIGVLVRSNGVRMAARPAARAAASRCPQSSPLHLDHRQLDRKLGRDDLHGTVLALDDRGPQRLVPGHDRGQRRAQRVHVEVTAQPQAQRHAVDGAVRGLASRNQRVSCACDSGAGPASRRGVGPGWPPLPPAP